MVKRRKRHHLRFQYFSDGQDVFILYVGYVYSESRKKQGVPPHSLEGLWTEYGTMAKWLPGQIWHMADQFKY